MNCGSTKEQFSFTFPVTMKLGICGSAESAQLTGSSSVLSKLSNQEEANDFQINLRSVYVNRAQ